MGFPASGRRVVWRDMVATRFRVVPSLVRVSWKANRPMRSFTARVVVVLALAACTREADRPVSGEILVAAAADLALAMPELTDAFHEQTGLNVIATLGSTGQLAQQIEAGAPIDVFLAADRIWVDRLQRADRLEDGTRAVYAYGVLVYMSQDETIVRSGLEGIRSSAVRRLAIANPEHAPYGRAAKQVLESVGMWADLDAKIVLAENARQTVQFVETKAVDAAIAPLSLMTDGRGYWTPISDSLHEPIEQTLAIPRSSAHKAEARRFAAFITSQEGQAILVRYRFVLPE